MTKISLHDYQKRITKMLDDNQVREAAAHCRHILQQYPRHVETYRALAQALLEQGEYAAAIDLFHRVLSAEPNDFISHLGLAIIFEDQETLPKSIWHMERAFEIKPYDAIVEQKLRELYQASGSKVPKRLPLTQGALARLYLRGELYQNAITELGQALLEDKDRIDLEVLLAEALWRDDQRVDTVEVCRSVLEKLPNCISANAILAEVWQLTGRVSEAGPLLQRLQTLTQADTVHCDLDSPVGRAFRANGAQYLPDRVEIEYLDVMSADLADSARPEEADEYADDLEEIVESEGMFGWLSEDAFGEEEYADEEEEGQGADAGMPAESLWLVDQEKAAAGDTGDLANLPDWLMETDASQAAPADLPGDSLPGSKDLGDPIVDGYLDRDSGVASYSEPAAAEMSAMPEASLDEGERADVEMPEKGQDVPSWLEGTSDTDFRPIEADPSMLESSWFSSQLEHLSADSEDQFISEDDAEWLSLLDEVDAEASEPMELPDFAFNDLPAERGAGLLPDWLAEREGSGRAETAVPGGDDHFSPPSPGDLASSEEDYGEEMLPGEPLSEDLALQEEMVTDDEPSDASLAPIEAEVPDYEEVTGDEELESWSASSAGFDSELMGQADDELPDWLHADQFDTMAGIDVVEKTMDSLGLGTDLLSLDKTNLPAWLRDQEPDEGEDDLAAGETTTPALWDEGVQSDATEGDDWALAEDQMDQAEPESMMAEMDELDDAGLEKEEELPDWLRGDPLDTLVGKMAVDQTVESLGMESSLPAGDDLDIPEWLQPEESESGFEVAVEDTREGMDALEEEMFELGDADLPEWLQGDQLDTMVGKRAVDMTTESLLADQQADGTYLEESALSDDAEGFPGWLDELQIAEGDESAMLEQLSQVSDTSLEAFGADEALEWLIDVDAGGQLQSEELEAGESDDLEGAQLDVEDVLPESELEQVVGLVQPVDEVAFLHEPVEEPADETVGRGELPEPEPQPLGPGEDAAGLAYGSEADWWDERVELVESEGADDDASLKWDEELAWIEELAAGEGDVPGDDLRFVDKSEPELEVRDSVATEKSDGEPDAMVEAMGWLEEVADEGIERDNSIQMAITEGDPLSLEPATMDDIGDYDEAMTWLEELVAGEEALAAGEPLADEAQEMDLFFDELESAGTASQLLEEEGTAIEWLEEMAGDVQASDEELHELAAIFDQDYEEGSEVDEFDLDLPDWEDSEMEPLTGEASADLVPLTGTSDEAVATDKGFAVDEEAVLEIDELPELSLLETDEVEQGEAPSHEVSTSDLVADMDETHDALDDSLDWLEAPSLDEEFAALESVDSVEWAESKTGAAAETAADDIDEIADLHKLLAPEELIADEELSWLELGDEAEWLEGEAGEEPDTLTEAESDADLVPSDEASMATTDEFDASLAWLEEEAPVYDIPDEGEAELQAIVELGAELEVDEYDLIPEAIETQTLDEPEGASVLEPVTDEASPATEPVSEEALQQPAGETGEAPDDLEDAMVWLEQLAARQGAPAEELPTVALAEAPIEEEPAETEAPEMLAESATAFYLEDADDMTGAEGLPAETEATEDLDDAMTWLEDLAAKQGVPTGELPDPSALAGLEGESGLGAERESEEEGEAEPAITEAPEQVVSDIEEDLDEAMAWLEGLAAQEESLLAKAPATLDDAEPSTAASDQQLQFPGAPEPSKRSGLSAELEEALDWLQQQVGRERVAEEDGVSLEPITLEVSDQELNDTLDWLEQLALSGRPEPDAGMSGATSESTAAFSELDTLIAEEEAVAEIQELQSGFEASIEGAPLLEELPDIVTTLEEPEASTIHASDVDAIAEPIEPGAAVDEPSVEVTDGETAELRVKPTFGGDEDTLFELSVGVSEGMLEDDFLDEIPEDPDAALAWLEAFIEESETPSAEPSLAGTTPAIEWEAVDAETDVGPTEGVLDESEAGRLTSQLLEEMGDEVDQELLDSIPEDPDEAVAWLQQFSHEAEIPLKEPLQDDKGDDLALPDTPAADVSAGPLLPLSTTDVSGLPVEDGLAEDIGARLEEDLAEALPEWLMDEPDVEEETKRTDWLRSLPEPDVAGWLEAEEEVTLSGVHSFDALAGPAETGLDQERSAAIELPEEGTREEPADGDEEEPMPAAETDLSQLSMARASLESGDYDEAITVYQSLVEQGGGLNTLIDDLEAAAGAHPSQPLLRRLLGDAYMKNGQLQKALDNYRRALDRL